MKKLVVMSAIVVFLAGLVVQANSTISWDFNTVGDAEGWVPSHADSMTEGLIATHAVQGSEGVLTTPDVTANDPGAEMTETNSVPPGEYWDTLEIRIRALTANADEGGVPMAYYGDGSLAVINWEVVSYPMGTPGSSWVTTNEANEWIVTTLDISSIGTNDIWYLRVDPPVDDPGFNRNFEIDYIKLHSQTNTPPPPVYKTAWEFNTPGDTEGWVGNVVSTKVDNAIIGSESVLTCDDAGVADPQVMNNSEPANLVPGRYWSMVEMRIRLRDNTDPLPWDSSTEGGTLFLLNGTVLSATIGGAGWETTEEEDNWIVSRFDISPMGNHNIHTMRIDPFHEALGRNFEIDYIRFETRATPPLPPAPPKLIKSWEFNTLGDTEDFTAVGVDTLMATNAITGSESVLTCADVTGNDPQLSHNAGNSSALSISPDGPWKTIEIRLRQLDMNPGDAGVASLPFSIAGTLVFINPGTANSKNLGGIVATTNEAGNWVVAEIDISYLGANDFINLRLDPVGNTAAKNFEVDYVRLYAEGSRYDAWSQVVYGLVGTNALPTADADGDGFANLYEFAMGGDPTNAMDIGFVPTTTIVDVGGTNHIDYTHVQRANAATFGLNYYLELTDDPVSGSWTNSGYMVAGQSDLGNDFLAITNRLAELVSTNIHIRLAIVMGNDIVYSAITKITELDIWAAGYGLYGEDAAPTADPDADGLTNESEFDLGTNPANDDTDSDGMPDGWEHNKGLDPLVDDAGDDPDSDTLTNLEEYGYGTHPKQSDTDNDGLRDDAEINSHGTDPLDPDSDDDGMPDGYEIAKLFDPNVDDAGDDADSDGLSNLGEYQQGTDPHDDDSDDDGMKDGWEVANYLNPKLDDAANDPDTDYLNNLQEYQAGTDPQDDDSDDDGLIDGIEILMGLNPTNSDSDSDGMPDGWEQSYGLLPLVDDAAGNKDGDEHSNLQEFITGMSPSDPGSIFTASPAKADAGTVVVWPSFTNRTYTVQWTDNLTNSFQALEPTVDYPQNSYTDTLHAADSEGFYKVDVQLK